MQSSHTGFVTGGKPAQGAHVGAGPPGSHFDGASPPLLAVQSSGSPCLTQYLFGPQLQPPKIKPQGRLHASLSLNTEYLRQEVVPGHALKGSHGQYLFTIINNNN
jgi:hypothetical protein